MDEAAKRFKQFIFESKGQIVDKNDIERAFEKNLPSCVKKVLLEKFEKEY